MQKRWW
jgi:hypothetical protein